VQRIAGVLRAHGATCHVFHDRPIEVPGCAVHVRRPLEEVARRIAGLDAMVAVDSGLLHLAACLGVPTVGVFGPTNGPITCEFYPSASIVQAGQPRLIGCYVPCYYAAPPNGYGSACKKRQGRCIKELDAATVAEEALRRAIGEPPLHRIPEHWLALNFETRPCHGAIHGGTP
jgi:ADP-heptose:LPS heptosyltransferase